MLILSICMQAIAQKSMQKYKRSSLWTFMIDKPEQKYDSVILEAFTGYPIPEKFNEHNGSLRLIPQIQNDFHGATSKTLSKKMGLGLLSKMKGGDDGTSGKSTGKSEQIAQILKDSAIARKMVSKWFNRSDKGGFNMQLVAERGSYNASDIDIKVAKSSERGLALVRDAGEELIQNTFVVVNEFKFTNKEEVAKKARGVLSLASTVASYAGNSTMSYAAEGAGLGVGVVGKGYVIKTDAYLFRLVWNEEVASSFYNDYWTDDSHLDPAKVNAFDQSDLFTLEFVGMESAWADLQSTVFTKKSEEELISIATKKASDAVIAKLQRKFEVFRTKTPLLSGDPISAKIGLKEGLEKGDKYEVLEQTVDKNGRTTYERVGIIKVEKNNIWDNRYMAEVENPSSTQYTVFKGSKNKFTAGMLIRQIN